MGHHSRSDLLIARREERTGVGVDHPNVAQIEGYFAGAGGGTYPRPPSGSGYQRLGPTCL